MKINSVDDDIKITVESSVWVDVIENIKYTEPTLCVIRIFDDYAYLMPEQVDQLIDALMPFSTNKI